MLETIAARSWTACDTPSRTEWTRAWNDGRGLLMIAIALVAYGSYHALNAIAMLPAPAKA
jgi:hypothetical protein